MEMQHPDREHELKPYEAPAVIYEAPLEIRAGSPPNPGIVDPMDLLLKK